MTIALPFDNTYARLPQGFHAHALPTQVRAPRLVKLNTELAQLLGLETEQLSAELLSGNVIADGSEPIALAYAGHQFGSFVPQLGDGRAILLGEVVGRDGVRRDVQLKGAGRTRFSRGGDGRAAIGPVLREYVVSEAMAALGIPTTRALAAVLTGEPVMRERALPGAVITRVAASHIRVGTFEFFAARDDVAALRTLATYALTRHHPDSLHDNGGNHALTLVERTIEAHASLVARWLGVGFVHGVMNTDNTSISGETLDYGPCAFLDEYDPKKTFSSIDHGGRYAYANQPRMAQWNLARLCEALLPLLDDDHEVAVKLAMDRLNRFPSLFEAAYTRVLREKLGLASERDDDLALAKDLLDRLAASAVDFTIFFRRLCACAEDSSADVQVASMFAAPSAFHEWATRWRARAPASALMRRANPAFIPRNHRIEEMIAAAVDDDFAPFETLVRVLARPWDDQPDVASLAEPPKPEERVLRTFCGT